MIWGQNIWKSENYLKKTEELINLSGHKIYPKPGKKSEQSMREIYSLIKKYF